MHLSIRWRLTLWNSAALAVVLLGFGALVYGLLAHTHRRIDRLILDQLDQSQQKLDRSLVVEFQELEQDPRMANDRDERLRYWIHEFREHENICCVVFDLTGKVYERTAELAAISIPPAPQTATDEFHFADIDLAIIGGQRMLTTRRRLGGKEFTVLLLAPLEGLDRERQAVEQERHEIDRQVGKSLAVLFSTVPVVLLLSGGLGYLLARKALAPMERLHRATAQITVDRLDRRLPVAHPRDELGRLTQTINAMIGRLERSFAEIRRFTADASHELRTPLTAIRTEAEVALGKELSRADYQHLLSSILEECERLTRLTDQLLTLSREDAGTTRPAQEPLDLAVLLHGVVETMRLLAETKEIQLSIADGGPVRMRGDEGRLRQVFYNLLDNAIKYTATGGRIEVQVGQQAHGAVVTLRDTGIGIPAEHLPRVFDRFYRVDKARTREQGGTGLGLSIARSIARAHGGEIELTSTPEVGTTCTVTLPLEANGDQGG